MYLFCSRELHPAIIEHLASTRSTPLEEFDAATWKHWPTATEARIVMNIDTFSVERLGTSATVEEVNIGERPMIKITGTPNESTVSVLVRAPTHHVVEEIKRAFDDAIGVVSIANEDQSVYPEEVHHTCNSH